MKLTVLGCWAPYPRPWGACSGYLVQEGDVSVLLDCGHGVVARLQQHVDFRQLDAVVITHFHWDHFADLFALIHAVRGAFRDGSRNTPLPVFLPPGPEERRGHVDKYGPYVQRQNIEPGVSIMLADGKMSLTFYPTRHSLPCYAVAVEGGGKRLVYTADTGWEEGLVSFAAGADLLLAEASFPGESKEEAEAAGHLTAAMAGELAHKAQVKSLMLTHFWPEFNVEGLRREAEQSRGGPVILAMEGRTYNI